MNAQEIVSAVQADGLQIALVDDGTVGLKGDSETVNRWIPVIGKYKQAVIAALTASAHSTCATCDHALPRRMGPVSAVPCGAPVEAGLSDTEGVISYHHLQGQHCRTWEPRLPADLRKRILAMAERWNYSGDELAIALRDAALNPAGWLLTVQADESGV